MNIKLIFIVLILMTTFSFAAEYNGILYVKHKQKLNQINKLWETLPKNLQIKWFDEQAAWNKNHQKVCSKEQGDLYLICKIDVIGERIEELKEKYKATNATPYEQVQVVEAILESSVDSLPPDFNALVSDFRHTWQKELLTKCGNDMVCTIKAIEEKTEEIEELLVVSG